MEQSCTSKVRAMARTCSLGVIRRLTGGDPEETISFVRNFLVAEDLDVHNVPYHSLVFAREIVRVFGEHQNCNGWISDLAQRVGSGNVKAKICDAMCVDVERRPQDFFLTSSVLSRRPSRRSNGKRRSAHLLQCLQSRFVEHGLGRERHNQAIYKQRLRKAFVRGWKRVHRDAQASRESRGWQELSQDGRLDLETRLETDLRRKPEAGLRWAIQRWRKRLRKMRRRDDNGIAHARRVWRRMQREPEAEADGDRECVVASLNVAGRLSADVVSQVEADVLLVQETHQRPGRNPRSFPFWTSVHCVQGHSRRGAGGVAVLVKRGVAWSPLGQHDGAPLAVDDVHWVWARIETQPKPLFVASLYAPPRANWSRMATLLDQAKVLVDQGKVLIGGDMNIDLRSLPDVRNYWERTKRLARNRSLGVTVSRPRENGRIVATRVEGRRCIDWFFEVFSDEQEVLSRPTTIVRGVSQSDHHLVVCKSGARGMVLDGDDGDRIRWRRLQDDEFRERFQARVDDGIDECNDLIDVQMLLQEAGRATLGLRDRARDRKNRYPAWADERFVALARKLKKLARKIQRSRDRATVRRFRAEKRRVGREFQEHNDATRTQFYRDIASKWERGCNASFSEACQMLNRFSKGRRKASFPFDGREMVRQWKGVFEARPSAECNVAELDRQAETLVANWNRHRGWPKEDPFSPEEVEEASKRIKANKAPGPDGVSSGALHALSENAVIKLTELVNETVNDPVGSRFDALCTAKVILIDKKDKPESPLDYRPISLLSVLYKLVEHCMWARIKKRAGGLGPHEGPRAFFASPLQAGFVGRRGCQHQQMILNVAREHAKRAGETLIAVFLDCKKAYDSAQMGYVFEVMFERKHWPVNWLPFTWLSTRNHAKELCVPGMDAESRTCQATRGVPQGAILSPVLFNICMDGLERKLEELDVAKVQVHGLRFNHLCFADDTVLLAHSVGDMNRLLATATEWGKMAGMSFHPQKSIAMILEGNPGRGTLRLDGNRLDWKEETLYLGFRVRASEILTDQLLSKRLTKTRARMELIRTAASPRRGVDAPIGVLIASTTAFNSLLYGCLVGTIDSDLVMKLATIGARGALGVTKYSSRRMALAFTGWNSVNVMAGLRVLNLVNRAASAGTRESLAVIKSVLMGELTRDMPGAMLDDPTSCWIAMIVNQAKAVLGGSATEARSTLRRLMRMGNQERHERVEAWRDLWKAKPHIALRGHTRCAHAVYRFCMHSLDTLVRTGMEVPRCRLCNAPGSRYTGKHVVEECRHAGVRELLDRLGHNRAMCSPLFGGGSEYEREELYKAFATIIKDIILPTNAEVAESARARRAAGRR